jgi:hypothetical protein
LDVLFAGRDGRDDLVIADAAQVTVLLGQDSGAPGRVAAYPRLQIPRGAFPYDGDLDLAYAATYGGAGVIAVTNDRLVD